MTWREHIAPQVAKVLYEAKREGLTYKETRKALRKANPYLGGPSWMYHVWCQEVRYQMGLATRPTRTPREHKNRIELANPNQMRLFDP